MRQVDLTKVLIHTNTTFIDLSILLLRLTVGSILFGAGAGKVLRWFGGFGMEMTVQFFAQIGISAPLAYLSSYAEFIGGLLLILGLLTRPAALAITINMLVAFLVTLPKGFLMGMAAYPFSLMIIALILLLTGPGRYSIDWLLTRNRAEAMMTQ